MFIFLKSTELALLYIAGSKRKRLSIKASPSFFMFYFFIYTTVFKSRTQVQFYFTTYLFVCQYKKAKNEQIFRNHQKTQTKILPVRTFKPNERSGSIFLIFNYRKFQPRATTPSEHTISLTCVLEIQLTYLSIAFHSAVVPLY